MAPGKDDKGCVDLTEDDDEVQEMGESSGQGGGAWAGARVTRRQLDIRDSRGGRFTEVLSYPPGHADAVTITLGDVERLKEGEFLNDSLVDFMCRFLLFLCLATAT